MDVTRKKLIVASLIVLWGGLAYWQWMALPDQARVPLANVSGQPLSSPRAIPSLSPGGLRVHLEQLASAGTQREAMFTAPRNIFALPGSDGTLAIAGEGGSAPVPDQVSNQTLQQQAVSLELAQYRYLGFVRIGEAASGTKNTAVLSKNDEVVIGRVGQRLEPHLVVKAVTPENVTLRDIQASIEHTIPLTEDAVTPQP